MRIVILLVLDAYLLLHASVLYVNTWTKQEVDNRNQELNEISQNFSPTLQARNSHESPR